MSVFFVYSSIEFLAIIVSRKDFNPLCVSCALARNNYASCHTSSKAVFTL